MTHVLAIYRGRLIENRGTPIRVRTILELLARDPRFSLTVASWDETLSFAAHVRLTNRKFDDMHRLTRAAKGVDVVMGHTMATWYYLAFLKIFLRKPIVLEMHGFLEEEARLYGDVDIIRYYFSKFVYGLFYRILDAATTCGGLGTDILQSYNPRVRPMIGGVDMSMFKPDAVPGGYVKREPGQTVIGYAGNARKWQGLPFLAEAFNELHAEDRSFSLAILSSEKKGLPEGEGVTVVPGVPHDSVPQFLAECDILVIPREVDRVSRLGPPSKLLEYMAMGKPVVVSRVGYMDVIVSDGVSGRTFEPGDTESFKAILRELKDPAIRERLGREAARTVRERYTWEKEIDNLTGYLLKVARRS